MIDPDRFWRLLPQLHQRRDAESGFVLRALLELWAEQAAVLDADIARQYDNWFIETCDDWVVSYIADAIGYTRVHSIGSVSPRREVANTIRYRRRKGTLAVLEQIAGDVTGWPARAVEFRHLVLATHHLRSSSGARGGTAPIRGLLAAGPRDPADTLPRMLEVRRISAPRQPGRYGPRQVGLFMSRLRAVSVTGADAACADEAGAQCFRLDPAGADIALFRAGASGTDVLPGPLARGLLASARDEVYGEGRSLMLWEQPAGATELTPVKADRLVPARLAQWRERPVPGKVAVDPELGRVMFPDGAPPTRLLADYHEGAAGDLGAGERPRPAPQADETVIVIRRTPKAGEERSLAAALARWAGTRRGAIEFGDSASYDEGGLAIELRPGEALEIRAGSRCRPMLKLLDRRSPADDPWRIALAAGSTLVLDGLLIGRGRLQVQGDGGALVLRRCTFRRWGREAGGSPAAASLLIDGASLRLRIERSMLGPISVRDDELAHEPSAVDISDSVVDGGSGIAIAAAGAAPAHVSLTIERSTVLGEARVHEVRLAQDCIFRDTLAVARRQRGGLRFCALPRGSRTPRRYECVLAAGDDDPEAGPSPIFVSLRMGDPGYCQLAEGCPPEIRSGASDQSELGVFHDQYTPQREANLRARFDEYVPADIDVGVIYVT